MAGRSGSNPDSGQSQCFFPKRLTTTIPYKRMKIKYNKKSLFSVFLILISVFLQSCHIGVKQHETQTLWYKQPAKEWEDALPLGNGRFGAMVFGKTDTERIQLNDDSLWPGDEGWDEPAGTKEELEKIRELLIKGEHQKADKMLVEKFSRKGVIRSHQTLGDLYFDFGHENISDYRRELDLETAVAKVNYKTNGKLVSEKVFVSNPHNVMVVEIKSNAPDGLNGAIRLTRPDDQGVPTVKVSAVADNRLVMRGEVTQRDGKFDSQNTPILEGVKFETVVKVKNEGGEVFAGNNQLVLKGVHRAVFFLVSNSSYYFDNYSGQNIKDLTALDGLSVKEL